MNGKNIAQISLILILNILVSACENSTPSELEFEGGSLIFTLSKEVLHENVVSITISLSRADLENIVRNYAIEDTSITIHIDSLAEGEWNMKIEAMDKQGYVFQNGAAIIHIIPGQTTSTVIILHYNNIVSIHYFDDGEVPYWGGNALMENDEGALKLTSTSPANWCWEIFDHGYPGIYKEGDIEFDINFGMAGYYFDFRGHSENDLSDINWGPLVEFREGKVYVNINTGTLYDTETRYFPGEWYHIRVLFNNNEGQKGRYNLFIRNIANDESEILLGEFDYYASQGRLADIVQYSFGLRTLSIVTTTSMYIDNVKLEVW